MALAQVPTPVPLYCVRGRQPGRQARGGTGYLSGGGDFHWQTNLPLLVSRGERSDRDAACVFQPTPFEQKDRHRLSIVLAHTFSTPLLSSPACCCLAIIDCAALLCFPSVCSGPLRGHSIEFATHFPRQSVHVPAWKRFQRDTRHCLHTNHTNPADETQLDSCFQTRTERGAAQFQALSYTNWQTALRRRFEH